MSKSFNDTYNEIFSKYHEKIKVVQSARKKEIIICSIIYGILVAFLLYARAYDIILQFSILYFVLSTIIVNVFAKNRRDSTYKTGVINDLVKAVYPASEYTYDRRHFIT